MSDHYVKRNPRIVANACLAIEQHYFGDESALTPSNPTS